MYNLKSDKDVMPIDSKKYEEYVIPRIKELQEYIKELEELKRLAWETIHINLYIQYRDARIKAESELKALLGGLR